MTNSNAIVPGVLAPSSGDHGEHPPHLLHHFQSVEQQADATNFAMWLFLLSEVMFFGGLFTAYLIYRNWYIPAFVAGAHQLNVGLGALNSVLLILSSFSLVMGVWCAENKRKGGLVLCLILTFILGLGFLGIKSIEYAEKIEKHHFPGIHYSLSSFLDPGDDEAARAAGDQPLPLDMARHTELYFSLYFAMTGMHALHMIVGMGILVFMIVRARGGAYTAGHVNFVRNFSLYWNLVDIVWIYLFALLYLVSRH